jgi:hypothetical protein
MKLPIEAIREFQAAWFVSFEESITLERAEMEANMLLQLYASLTGDFAKK